MSKTALSALQNPSFTPAASVELFGHVTLVEAYDVPSYQGCHALIQLRDSPGKTVAVLTTSERIGALLQGGLQTKYLIAFRGSLLAHPPAPLGGTWAVPVYGDVSSVILYSAV